MTMINNEPLSSLHTLKPNPTLTQIHPGFDYKSHGYIKTNTEFVNYTSAPITIVERGGLRHTVPANPNSQNPVFIIRRTITVNFNAHDSMQRLLSTVTNESPAELKIIKEAFTHQLRASRGRNIDLVVDHVITREDLQAREGDVYYSTTDMVVSVKGLLEAPSHPYSSEVFTDIFNVEKTKSGVGIHYEIVDNDNTIAERYFKIGGEVVGVKPHKNPNKPNGVYVTTYRKNTMGINGKIVSSIRHEFKDCEKLGLYKTVEEAQEGGDVNLARKERIAILESEIQENNRRAQSERQIFDDELRRMKHQQELENAKFKEEERMRERLHKEHMERIDRIQQERERLQKEEAERMREEYEKRKAHRDDFQQVLKFLPAVIISIGALYAAYVKVLTPKEPKK